MRCYYVIKVRRQNTHSNFNRMNGGILVEGMYIYNYEDDDSCDGEAGLMIPGRGTRCYSSRQKAISFGYSVILALKFNRQTRAKTFIEELNKLGDYALWEFAIDKYVELLKLRCKVFCRDGGGTHVLSSKRSVKNDNVKVQPTEERRLDLEL
jgi:hypothetical protein